MHRQLYERLDEAQDRLGEVVDQLAAIDRLRDWLDEAKKKHRGKLRALLSAKQQRLDRLRQKLIRWWSPARRQRLRKLWQKAVSCTGDPPRRAACAASGSYSESDALAISANSVDLMGNAVFTAFR